LSFNPPPSSLARNAFAPPPFNKKTSPVEGWF
jgi:hypothetical protein